MTVYSTFSHDELERALYVAPNPAVMLEAFRRFGIMADEVDATHSEARDLLDQIDELECAVQHLEKERDELEETRDRLQANIAELERA